MWLYQLARQVPLAWWSAHTGMAPADLAAWADEGEWAEALWLAWRDVLQAAPDAGWAEALLASWPADAPPAPGRRRPPRAVLGDRGWLRAMLPPAARARDAARRAANAGVPVMVALVEALADRADDEDLPPGLALPLAQRLRQALAAPAAATPQEQAAQRHAFGALARGVVELACALPPAMLAETEAWLAAAPDSPAVAAARHSCRQIVQARRALDATFPPRTTP